MTIFQQLKNKVATPITYEQLQTNKKYNSFYTNFQGGSILNKELIKAVAKSTNQLVTYDYVKMIAEFKPKDKL